MKLKLNKKKLKNLSKDNKVLPVELTAQIGGGRDPVKTTDMSYLCPHASQLTC